MNDYFFIFLIKKWSRQEQKRAAKLGVLDISKIQKIGAKAARHIIADDRQIE